jgi:hypothetical protein
MFTVNADMSIYATRGDVVFFGVKALENGEAYMFKPGDIVRFSVTEKKACNCVVLSKDFPVAEEVEMVNIVLSGQETKFGDPISKPKDYWYEVELNPDTKPQTIIGYDEKTGAKIFKLFPESDTQS